MKERKWHLPFSLVRARLLRPVAVGFTQEAAGSS